MENLIYTVYKTTNTINNKIYIGVHATTNPNDDYMGSGVELKEAIRNQGVDNFTKTILFEYSNKEDMFLKERELVTKYFIKQDTNYNLSLGGNGGFNIKPKESNCSGLYITPHGNFKTSKLAETPKITSNNIFSWCKRNNQKVISPIVYNKSKYLQQFGNSIIGKTMENVGFSYKT